MGLMITSSFVRTHTDEAVSVAKTRLKQLDRKETAGQRREDSFFSRNGAPITINYSPWNWGSNYYNYNYGTEETSRDKTPSYAWAGMLGLAAAVGGAMITGMLYDNYMKTFAEKNRAEFIKRAIFASQWDPSISEEVKAPFKSLVATQEKIAKLDTSKWTNYMLSAAMTAGGGASCAIGAITTVSLWVAAGQVTLVVAVILAAWNFGAHYNDEEKLRVLLSKIVGMPGGLGVGYADLVRKALNPTSFAVAHPVRDKTIRQEGGIEKLRVRLNTTETERPGALVPFTG